MAVDAKIIERFNDDTIKQLTEDLIAWGEHFGKAAISEAEKINGQKNAHNLSVLSDAAYNLAKSANKVRGDMIRLERK